MKPLRSMQGNRSRPMLRGARVLALATAVVASVFDLVPPAAATEYHVAATSESRREEGSRANPFHSIAPAIAVARPGDTILVHPGVYHERLDTRRDGRPDAPITLRGTVPGRAVVAIGGSVLTLRNEDWIVEGMVFDGGMGHAPALRVRDRGAHLAIRDVVVRNSGSNCIDIDGSDVLIERTLVSYCLAGTGAHPVDAHGITGNRVRRLTVRDSTIEWFSGDGLQFSPAREPWGDVLVERTRIRDGRLPEDRPGFPAGTLVGENAFDSKVSADGPRPRVVFRDVSVRGFRGVITDQGAFNIKERVDFTLDRATVSASELAFRLRGPAWVLLRNVVTFGNDATLRYEDGLPGLRIENSTFADRDAFRDGGGADPVGMSVRNTLFVGAHRVPHEIRAFRSNLAVGVSAVRDARRGDFHLRAGSPAIDAGEPIPELDHDRDGAPRPEGVGYDVGAFEYGSTPSPPAAPVGAPES